MCLRHLLRLLHRLIRAFLPSGEQCRVVSRVLSRCFATCRALLLASSAIVRLHWSQQVEATLWEGEGLADLPHYAPRMGLKPPSLFLPTQDDIAAAAASSQKK
eukprot:1449981-Amphidinium_carterae.1